MARAGLLVFALVALLTVLRGLRIFFAAIRRRDVPGRPSSARVEEQDMVRDPVCGTWVDRRLALPARQGGQTISVCSESCRRSLEAAP
jgi:YHS domain-containing protein